MLKEYLEGKRKMEDNSLQIHLEAEKLIMLEVRKFTKNVIEGFKKAEPHEVAEFLNSEEIDEREKMIVFLAFLEEKKKGHKSPVSDEELLSPDLSQLFKDI